MRSKALLLALTVVVACGAGPFRGGVVGRVPGPMVAPYPAAAAQAQVMVDARAPEFAQVAFKGPKGLTINYDVGALGLFDSEPILCEDPGKPQTKKPNFQTARSYRLKLSNLPNSQLTLYPTLTINAVSPRTKAYLDHNALPIEFSMQDLENVLAGNFVTKVVFLPSQQYQNLALAGGASTVVSTQLPPGANPILEAQNRGAILAVVQIGNKDLEGMTPTEIDAAEVTAAQQFPISGVNVPAFGSPAAESATNTAELPTVPLPPEQPALQNLSPVPSSGIPSVLDSTWSGSRF
ncbi:MAG: hypothetical protein PHO46_11755 [Thermoguttaceae bacterium]|nr:hypothetical protein [Thermoguttaceae bacterium]